MKYLRTLALASLLVPSLSFAQYIDEDAAHGSGDRGIIPLSKRTDTAATSAGSNGDYATINTDSTGRVWVNATGTGATDLGKAEDAAHTSGDTGVMALGVRVDSFGSLPLAGTTGDYMPFTLSSMGALNAYIDSTTQASGTTGLLKIEDSASGNAHALVGIGAVRDDALTSGAGAADGDWVFANVDTYGALWTHPTIKTTVLTDTATIEAAAYDANDCIMAAAEALTGTAATAPFLTGRITDVVVTDLAAQAANLELYIFSGDPGAVCAAINSDLDIADDDLAKVQAVIPITQHFSGADNSISTASNLNQKYTLASGTTLYYALISRGTPTYASVADLVISIKVELD